MTKLQQITSYAIFENSSEGMEITTCRGNETMPQKHYKSPCDVPVLSRKTMRLILTLCVLVAELSLASAACNTAIVRDVVATNEENRINFENGLGNVSGRVVPVINEPIALELRHKGSEPSNHPVFTLDQRYWVTAVDLQFGSVGDCLQDGEVTEIKMFSIGDHDDPKMNPTVQGLYKEGAMRDIINLKKFGDPNNGRIVRLQIQGAQGRILSFQVARTDPQATKNQAVKLCLRIEIHGCSASDPAPSSRELLQYNLVEPTVYSDAKYTGVLSQGYLSGGQGILNDGIIGGTGGWLGWSNSTLSNSEILFLFRAKFLIRSISIYYRTDDGTLSGVEISNEKGVISGWTQTTENVVRNVNKQVFTHRGVNSWFLRVGIERDEAVMLTEVVVYSNEKSLLGRDSLVLGTTHSSASSVTTSTSADTTPAPPEMTMGTSTISTGTITSVSSSTSSSSTSASTSSTTNPSPGTSSSPSVTTSRTSTPNTSRTRAPPIVTPLPRISYSGSDLYVLVVCLFISIVINFALTVIVILTCLYMGRRGRGRGNEGVGDTGERSPTEKKLI